MGVVFLFLLCAAFMAGQETQLTSRDQLHRLDPQGGLPKGLSFNDDRSVIEVVTDPKSCAFGRAFFELKVKPTGETKSVEERSIDPHARAGSITKEFIKKLLRQMHFLPLKVGGKAVATHTFVTVVCE